MQDNLKKFDKISVEEHKDSENMLEEFDKDIRNRVPSEISLKRACVEGITETFQECSLSCVTRKASWSHFVHTCCTCAPSDEKTLLSL